MTSADHLMSRTQSGHVLLGGHRGSGSRENVDPRRGGDREGYVRSTSPPLREGRVNLEQEVRQQEASKKPPPDKKG